MKRFAHFIATTGSLAALTLALPTQIQAQVPQAWEDDFCTLKGVATIQGVQCLLGNVFSVAITFIGLAAFVMLIIGSFGYMLSGGNAKGTEQARNTITFAIVGIVVALSAFIMINFVSIFTGVDEVTQFVIPESGNGTKVEGSTSDFGNQPEPIAD